MIRYIIYNTVSGQQGNFIMKKKNEKMRAKFLLGTRTTFSAHFVIRYR